MRGTGTGARVLRAAIAGNPNSGKTSLFNALTGSNQCVGNYPGVTVERHQGLIHAEGCALEMVDLPGTYSLTAYSAEEVVARNVLIGEHPDVVVDVVDASNLERNLYLTVQLMEMEVPLVIALNMIDVAHRHHVGIDAARMSALLGVPVVETVGREGRGKRDLASVCTRVARGDLAGRPKRVTYGHAVDECVDGLAPLLGEDDGVCRMYPPRWAAIKLLEGDAEIGAAVAAAADDPERVAQAAKQYVAKLETHSGGSAASLVAEGRYGYAIGIVRQCCRMAEGEYRRLTDRVDAVVCHRLLGPVILAAVVFGLFVSVFKLADEWTWLFGRSPSGWMTWLFDTLAAAAARLEAHSPMLHSLVVDGVIGGVGGVMAFVPLIFVMFIFVAALEDAGYIARVAFVMDRALRAFGLQGRSVLALIISGGLGGGGCAVPGVLATRTLRDPRDRLVTMLVVPLMNCGAKLPVYLMLVAAFFADAKAQMMFLLWALSWLIALTCAWVLRRFVFKGEHAPFVMELPSYHLPTARGVLRHAWGRTWMYIRKAGTIILAVSLVMWALMYFPRMDTSPYEARKAALASASHGGALTKCGTGFQPVPARVENRGHADGDELAAIESEQGQAQLRQSLAGRLGTLLTPVSRWAGFDWRDNVALVGGFAAKEVVVGTLGVAYSMGEVDAEAAGSLSARLAADPSWSRLRAMAMLVFVMIYAPCMSTLAVLRRESGSWKWALFSTSYTTVLAFLLAVGVYQIGGLLVGGA